MGVFESLRVSLENEDIDYSLEDDDILDISIEENVRNINFLPKEVLVQQVFEDQLNDLEKFINICEESLYDDSIDLESVMEYIGDTEVICKMFNMSLEDFNDLTIDNILEMYTTKDSIELKHYEGEINKISLEIKIPIDDAINAAKKMYFNFQKSIDKLTAQIDKIEDQIAEKVNKINNNPKMSDYDKHFTKRDIQKLTDDGKSLVSQRDNLFSRQMKVFKEFDDLKDKKAKGITAVSENKFNDVAGKMGFKTSPGLWKGKLLLIGIAAFGILGVFALIKIFHSNMVGATNNKIKAMGAIPIKNTNWTNTDVKAPVLSMSDYKLEINNIKKCCNDLVKISDNIYRDSFYKITSALNSSMSKCGITVSNTGKVSKAKYNKYKMSKDTLTNKGYNGRSKNDVLSMVKDLAKVTDNCGKQIKNNYQFSKGEGSPDSAKSARVVAKCYKTLMSYSDTVCTSQASKIIKALERASK